MSSNFNAPSITTWVRLEPRSRDAEMNVSLQARIYDPLWLLARQWQLGEFKGEDNGTPVIARWRGEASRLNRFRPASGTASVAYNAQTVPLETLVEREHASSTTAPASFDKSKKLLFAVRAGQHFIRLLNSQSLTAGAGYKQNFIAKFPFPTLTKEEQAQLDGESLGFFNLVSSRVPDGRLLYKTFRQSAIDLSQDLGIVHADVPKIQSVMDKWLQWCDAFFNEPDDVPDSWLSDRLEYSFSIGGRFNNGEKVLTAKEYFEGHLDWHAFDVNDSLSLDPPEQVTPVVCTTIPAPVTFRGMPAPRFWEFEDARVNFGAVDAGPTDLARMLLIEFALAYGNDWFVIPVELPVGTLSRTKSLVVTDTFGTQSLIRSSDEAGRPHSDWRMFQLSKQRQPGAAAGNPDANLFLLPPSLTRSLESKPIEEVHFLRDEMANMVWGVEHFIESSIERPLNRIEVYAQQHNRQQQDEVTKPPLGTYRYRLASEVPDYWIPLLPTKVGDGVRLRRGEVLKLDGKGEHAAALGRILEAGEKLSLYEEEVPREGVSVTRSFQFARWIDGSSHLWLGRRKQVGRGEGSSGLRFDILES